MSEALTERQCRDLIAATRTAERIGHPFNRFVTITWERSGVDARDNAVTTGRFIKLASDWMRARGYRLRWAWVQESSDGFRAHVHMLLHVPRDLDPLFGRMPSRWVKRLVPARCAPRTTDSRKVPYPVGYDDLNTINAYQAAIMGKVHYMLKGAPVKLEWQLGMCGMGHKDWGRSCTVFGKRLGIWQGWRTDSGT